MANDEWDDYEYSDDAEQQDDPYHAEHDAQYAPPKQGMSTGMKILIVLLCVFGGGALICCGAFGFLIYKVAPTITEDPAEVAAMQKEIVELDIPEDLHPNSGMKMDFIFAKMQMCEFQSEDAGTHLVLMGMEIKVEGQDANAEFQMRQALEEQKGDEQHVANAETTTQKLMVRGEEREFNFVKGERPHDGTAVRQVSGTFPSEKGIVMLMYMTDEEAYDEEAVIKMIESIK